MSTQAKPIDFKNPDVTKEELKGCMSTDVALSNPLRYSEISVSGVIFTGGASAAAVVVSLTRVGKRVFASFPAVQAALTGVATGSVNIPDGWRPIANSSSIVGGVNNSLSSSTLFAVTTAGVMTLQNAGAAWSTGTCGTGSTVNNVNWESAQ
jgi:hypothetical protein